MNVFSLSCKWFCAALSFSYSKLRFFFVVLLLFIVIVVFMSVYDFTQYSVAASCTGQNLSSVCILECQHATQRWSSRQMSLNFPLWRLQLGLFVFSCWHFSPLWVLFVSLLSGKPLKKKQKKKTLALSLEQITFNQLIWSNNTHIQAYIMGVFHTDLII